MPNFKEHAHAGVLAGLGVTLHDFLKKNQRGRVLNLDKKKNQRGRVLNLDKFSAQ